MIDVVLTHPSGWGAARRQTLRDAAASVFAEPRLVAEPVAAASFFTVVAATPMPVGSCAVVYDFGAGTFDVSVVRRTMSGFEVLFEHGLASTGGLDVDAALIDRIGETFATRDPARWTALTAPTDAVQHGPRRVFWEDVRTAKEMLSRSPSTFVRLPLFDTDVPLGREDLDDVARPIVERTVTATREAVDAAGVTPTTLAGIFLVGGSSRLPLAATLLHRAFGIPATATDQPELVVAEGSLQVGAPAETTSAPAPIAASGDTAWPVRSAPDAVAVNTRSGRAVARRRWRTLTLTVAAVGLAVLAGIAALRPFDNGDNGGGAQPSPSGPAQQQSSHLPASPSPSPSLSPVQCLIGTWQQTYNRANWTVSGRTIVVYSTGTINRFRADGIVVVEYLGNGVTRTGTSGSDTYEITSVGTITYAYRATDTTIYLSDPRPNGTVTTRVNGRVISQGSMTGVTEPQPFTCSDTTLKYANSMWSIEAVRLSGST